MSQVDPLQHLLVGYPKIAGHMNVQPETAIFRRFSELNAKDLLYRQAELAYLEKQLYECEIKDSQSTMGQKPQYAISWYWLSRSEADGDTKQLDLVMKIRKCIKEYNKALIRQSTILGFPEPSKCDLKDLQTFLVDPNMQRGYAAALIDEDARIWGSPVEANSHSSDIIALCPRTKEDIISGFVAKHAISVLDCWGWSWFKKLLCTHGVVEYKDSTIFKITYLFTSIVASLISVTSIIVLYRIDSTKARLGVIAAFNILMTLCLVGMTKAQRSDVFTITTAFAAVQVVFIAAEKTKTCG